MKKIASLLSAIILIFLSTIIGKILINRVSLRYNSEGKYFDENSLMVYDEQAIIGYGILFVIALGLALFSIKSIIKRIKS
jgi:hypothetical protein